MDWDEANDAIQDAKNTVAVSDKVAREVADLCAGRLRLAHVNGSTLTKLKEELRDYNIHTNCWRKK